ncbi:MAG: DNA primase [Myxococcaceae bacterium]
MIPEAKIDEIRERIDLVALVNRHGVELKKSGRSFKGRCPFHNEKTPSFYVWAEERRFKCFGCQAGGDAFSFVQRLLGKTFIDTVRDLAKEAGVDLEQSVDPALKEKAQIKEATDYAAEHFKKNLWDPVIGKKPREYLLSRGVSEENAKAFGLGWAPLAWSELADKLRENGLLTFGEKGGLVSPRARSDGYYDQFRGRLMIPIRSPEGRTIAFGGRLLESDAPKGEEGPKYLNSKESRLYNKSEVLYGLDQAREEIRKRRRAILVEGYFDAIGLHQAGVKSAVALCSTTITPGHLQLLNRAEAKELVLLLDGDDAGRKAVERLAGGLLAAGATAKVALLPDGEDPDTWARKVGEQTVRDLIDKAQGLSEYLFKTVLPKGDSASFEDKMSALERLKPIAVQIPVGLVRSAFFAGLSRHMGLPASELESALRGKQQPVKAVPKPGPGAAPPNSEGVVFEKPPEPMEALYVAALLRDKRLIQADTRRASDELKHSGLRTLVAALLSGSSPEDAVYDASEAVKKALDKERPALPLDEAGLERAFKWVCLKLKSRSVEEHVSRIARELSRIGTKADLTDESKELLGEQTRLLELKRELQKEERELRK